MSHEEHDEAADEAARGLAPGELPEDAAPGEPPDDELPPDEPILGRLLLIVVVVVAVLLGIRSWLGPHHPDAAPEEDGPRGAGPGLFAYQPPPGDYVQRVRGRSWTATAGQNGDALARPPETPPDRDATWLVPRSIQEDGDQRYVLREPYRVPEPDPFGPSPLLARHQDGIALRIELGSSGHVLDVTGPDDYLESIDEDQPDEADAVRALELEEQVDAVLSWQITAVMGQPALPGSAWTATATHPGRGGQPAWTGTLQVNVGDEQACPGGGAGETCLAVHMQSAPVPGLGVEVAADLLVGKDSGVEWWGAYARVVPVERGEGEAQAVALRRVERTLLRGDDPSLPAAGR